MISLIVMHLARYSRFFLFFLLLCMSCTLFAQDDDPDSYKLIKPKHSYSVDLWLPTGTANKSFRKLMQGIVRVGASYQFSLSNNLNMGIGANYSYFRINKFNVGSNPNVGGLNLSTGFIKLGYEEFYSERIGTEFSLKFGYSYLNFYSDSLQSLFGSSVTSESSFLEPGFSFILTASETTAYKWYFSYAFQGIGFNPTRIGNYDDLGFNPASFSTPTQYFTFGFTFTHYFKQRE